MAYVRPTARPCAQRAESTLQGGYTTRILLSGTVGITLRNWRPIKCGKIFIKMIYLEDFENFLKILKVPGTCVIRIYLEDSKIFENSQSSRDLDPYTNNFEN